MHNPPLSQFPHTTTTHTSGAGFAGLGSDPAQSYVCAQLPPEHAPLVTRLVTASFQFSPPKRSYRRSIQALAPQAQGSGLRGRRCPTEDSELELSWLCTVFFCQVRLVRPDSATAALMHDLFLLSLSLCSMAMKEDVFRLRSADGQARLCAPRMAVPPWQLHWLPAHRLSSQRQLCWHGPSGW